MEAERPKNSQNTPALYNDYEIATHTVKVKRSGEFNINALWNFNGIQ